MKRTATVALTRADQTEVNRLRVPEFGVLKLALVAGAAASKSYLPPGAPPPTVADTGTDDFHFAPENEKVKIKYTIDDVCGAIGKATLELYRRDKEEPVWKKALKPAEYANGDQELEWDGLIDKTDEFPEKYITVEHSPYKMRLVLEPLANTPLGYCQQAWTYFHVLVHEITLELGARETLQEARDKALWDVLKGTETDLENVLPKNANIKKVYLISNDFSMGNTDKVDNSLYTRYQGIWADGPNIPIFAKASIKTSADAKVDVPKAIGKVRFLWEWEDVPEDTSVYDTKVKEYVDLALDYDKNVTKPKGDNCHKDRGGKRGDDSKIVFPAKPGYAPAATLQAGAFPFKVEAAQTRKWSSYSYSWPTGKLLGQTGVFFQPSRMAGDAYKVHVYFPYNRKVDGTDDLDATDDNKLKGAVKQSTGTFQIWREVHIVSYTRKDATIAALNLGIAQKYYDPVYMVINDKTGGTIGTIANWNTKVRAEVNTKSDIYKSAVLNGDQGTLTKMALKFRAFADFKITLQATKTTWAPGELDGVLLSNNADTLNGYQNLCEAVADACVPQACSDFLVDNGINIIHFLGYWETVGGQKSSTLGFASTDFRQANHSKCGYLEVGDYASFTINGADKTTGHEIGHTLYLSHTVDEGGPADLHDQKSHWGYCLMSYNDAVENHFCGLCVLRLRGWDPSGNKLRSDRTQNKRP